MAKASRGAPSQFDILMFDLESDDDAEMTRHWRLGTKCSLTKFELCDIVKCLVKL